MKTPVQIIVFIVLMTMFVQTIVAGETGYVTKVIDGDSLLFKSVKGKKLELRLYGIDTPEWDQPNAKLSKRYLNDLIRGKKVEIEIYDIDRYGRSVSMVRRGTKNVNQCLVERGYAWVYPRYCKKKICKKWKYLEKKARHERKGLWQEKNPVSPWKWKHK